jgi:hypothetical protein
MLPYGAPIWTSYDKKLLSLIGTEERSGRMTRPTSDARSLSFRNRDKVVRQRRRRHQPPAGILGAQLRSPQMADCLVREIEGYGQENVRYSQRRR